MQEFDLATSSLQKTQGSICFLTKEGRGHTHIDIYIYVYIYVHIYIYIYLYSIYTIVYMYIMYYLNDVVCNFRCFDSFRAW